MKSNQSNIKKAKKYLNKNYCIGVPTETVYGLAGNAYSDIAVKKIFKLKKRPIKNPLIVHYLNINKLRKDCHVSDDFIKLYKKFCPGPITFILKRKIKSQVKPIVTANLNTIAVRFPSHRILRTILKNINFPLAMPSANVSSNVSPVRAEDVADEFKKRLKFIINGGNSKIGIESTVIDLTGKPTILRPGIIGPEIINKILKKKVNFIKNSSKIKSPGMLKKHYSPGIPIFLNQKPTEDQDAFITFGKKYKIKKNHFNLSRNSNLKEAASNLYRILRKIKKLKFKKIFVAAVPNKGPGIAINDRLIRAAKK